MKRISVVVMVSTVHELHNRELFAKTNVFSVDIDECETGAHNCSQRCNNTEGSYHCFCYDGYMLEADLQNCSGNFTDSHCIYIYILSTPYMYMAVWHCLKMVYFGIWKCLSLMLKIA